MVAGYSRRSLPEKLGIRPGTQVHAVNAPTHYATLLGDLPPGAKIRSAPKAEAEFIHIFARSERELRAAFKDLETKLSPDGMIWVSWPKRASGVETDLAEDVVRRVALESGLVDVKVCALDETWSGLKIVRRLKDRHVRRT